MYLGNIAHRWVNENLEAFDEATGTFVPDAMVGRISLVDRFLSNFNRPLRRRMLHYAVDTELPKSRTIRNPATGATYIIGQERTDSDDNVAYHSMAVCHLTTESVTSGLCQVYRKSPKGPADNPGWLVEENVGQHYTDLEFRTSLNEPDLEDTRVESFVLWVPVQADLEDYDFVELHDRTYRVTDRFFDSGFLMARVDEEADYRINVVIEHGESTVFNPDTMKYEQTKKSSNVTVTLMSDYDFSNWASDSSDYLDMFVEEKHIGFRPKPGMSIVYDGTSRVIRYAKYHKGERQYKIRCE